jgi:hypothetical protein
LVSTKNTGNPIGFAKFPSLAVSTLNTHQNLREKTLSTVAGRVDVMGWK